MSGESGSAITGDHYSLFVGAGVRVNVAVLPGDDGSAARAHFDRETAPYDRWLARARPDLDALFAEILADGPLPLVALDRPCEQIDGTIIEDTRSEPDTRGARHFADYHRGGPLMVHVGSNHHLPDGRSLNLRVHVATRVRRSDLDALVSRVAVILRAHQPEPPPQQPPPAPPPAPQPTGWLARLRRSFERSG